MAYGDPVLQRSMFRSPSVQPSVGFGSTTSADENAQALRNMFSPTVSISEPVAMIQQEQQPVQSFQFGGEAVSDRTQLERMEIPIPAALAPETEVAPRPASDGPSIFSGIPGLLRQSRGNPLLSAANADLSSVGGAASGVLEGLRDRFLRSRGIQPPAAPAQAPAAAPALTVPPTAAGPRISAEDLSRMRDADRAAEADAFMGRPAAAPAPERERGGIELTLEGIRADRARKAAEQAAAERQQRTASERRENALLALMQAGFAAAAGRSPNALTNIAAGGQAGVAAFAGMEKDRRADEAARRREETTIMMERERLRAQEERAPEAIRTYAMLGGWNPAGGTAGFNDAVRRGIEVTKSLEKEPDNIRLFKALGNGNLARGFEVYNSDNALKAANTTVNNLQASDEDRRTAQNYINVRIRQAQQAVSGSGQAPPAGSTVIPFNQLPVR
jgi:hypothetical protein